jgi:threonine efflux protein
MNSIHPLVTVALLNLAAAASPGPAFMLVSRTAAVGTRGVALATALGTALASVSWAAAALLGMQIILARFALIYRLLEIGGGIYLFFLGWSTWKNAGTPLRTYGANSRATCATGFRSGLLLGLSNPKVIVFFGTIFTTLFTPSTSMLVRWSALLVVLVNETVWYTTVATLFGTRRIRNMYARMKSGIERIFGGLFVLFGSRLLWRGARPSSAEISSVAMYSAWS